MLITPLGKLNVYKNNDLITYSIKKLSLKPIEICSYEVDERYLIEIDMSNINPGDTITYIIDTNNTNLNCEKDGGDCLVEAMFESDELFLAIGGYDINNGNYDIDIQKHRHTKYSSFLKGNIFYCKRYHSAAWICLSRNPVAHQPATGF